MFVAKYVMVSTVTSTESFSLRGGLRKCKPLILSTIKYIDGLFLR